MSKAATRSLRVAMISHYLPSESKIGVGYQVHALANAMVDRGHEVTVFSVCGETEGARYQTITLRPTGSNRTFKFALMLRKVDWSPFDVLHAHGDDYWLWRRRVAAHVRTLHGSCFNEARWVPGMREKLRMLLLGASEVLASLVADETVGVSRSSVRFIPWATRVLPNGVDSSRFRRRSPSEHPSILFVGTYLRRKRGKLLADVFEREILPRIPNAELWMVCEDGVPRPSVSVLGRVSPDVLADLYAKAWVFCLPSQYEGFGIPYAEALVAGCPVVATRNPGAIEVLAAGELGVVVSDETLGNALAALLQSPQRLEDLSREGMRVAHRYDVVTIAEEYERMYFDLLHSTRD